jgi:hypothetical protein
MKPAHSNFAFLVLVLQFGALGFANEPARSARAQPLPTISGEASAAVGVDRQENTVDSPQIVSGLVVSEVTGQPITNALVEVSSPAMEMRGLMGPRPGVYAARTDPGGHFKLELPPSPTISFNVFAAGYEEAAHQWMGGNTQFLNIPFATARKRDFKIQLRPGLYVRGVVMDESKRPVSEVAVEATMRESMGYGYVAFDQTDAKGRFQLFNFPLQPLGFIGGTDARGEVRFEHPDMLRTTLRDIYKMPPTERTNLQITLLNGHRIDGTISSATGQLVPELLVEAVPVVDSAARKSTITDARGRFTLRGLQGGVDLVAHSFTLKQKARKVLRLADADLQIDLRLEPVVYKNPPKIVSLFGMKLANVTPEVQEIYDLPSPNGIVILDPGKNHFRLGIGTLTEGESFWIVGNRVVNDLREMVFEILRICAIDPPGQPNEGCRGQVRIVYRYPRRAGTNTQRLTLNDNDMRELMELAARMQ